MKTYEELMEAVSEFRESGIKEPRWTAEDAKTLQALIEAPFKSVSLSTLGGVGRESLMISISLDPKSDWANGIFQNSSYLQLAIHATDTIILNTDGIRGGKFKRFRKQKFKSLQDAANRINKYLSGVLSSSSSSVG